MLALGVVALSPITSLVLIFLLLGLLSVLRFFVAVTLVALVLVFVAGFVDIGVGAGGNGVGVLCRWWFRW